jgi:integrase
MKKDLYDISFLMTSSYIDVRDRFMLQLMFLGLLRESEVVSLKRADVRLNDDRGQLYLSVFVNTSKTDPGGEGDLVVIEANIRRPRLCIVQTYLDYCIRRNPAATFLFHSSLKNANLKKPLSSTLPCDRLKFWLGRLGVDPSPYGSHSCRRGGTTAAAAAGISERLLQRHGRWKSLCVRIYIVEHLRHRLSVSRAINNS